jgi:hypothetical protein
MVDRLRLRSRHALARLRILRVLPTRRHQHARGLHRSLRQPRLLARGRRVRVRVLLRLELRQRPTGGSERERLQRAVLWRRKPDVRWRIPAADLHEPGRAGGGGGSPGWVGADVRVRGRHAKPRVHGHGERDAGGQHAWALHPALLRTLLCLDLSLWIPADLHLPGPGIHDGWRRKLGRVLLR